MGVDRYRDSSLEGHGLEHGVDQHGADQGGHQAQHYHQDDGRLTDIVEPADVGTIRRHRVLLVSTSRLLGLRANGLVHCAHPTDVVYWNG